MITIRDARKTFNANSVDARPALDGVDLALAAGDFAVLIGSNGAGKSTLLNAIAGSVMLDAGSIHLDGAEITRVPTDRRARDISRVFQDPVAGTVATMTIEENLLLAELRGLRPSFRWALDAGRRKRYRDDLARVGLGLEGRLTARAEQLSGGQRQALALIMAVLRKPKVLLLDEHTAALDPRTAALVLEASLRIVSEARITTVMVTHNMRQAIDCGNRLVMMEAGRIKLMLTDAEKRNATIDDLVARFGVASDRVLLGARKPA